MDRGLELFMQYQGLVAAWAAAIATTCAAVIALWLGTSDQRERRSRSRRSEIMLKHMLAAELFSLKNVAVQGPALLSHLCSDFWGNDEGKSNQEYLRWLGNRFRMPLAKEQFDAIANMNDEDARVLAALLGEVPRVHDGLIELADRYDAFGEVIEEAAAHLTERMKDIQDAIESLEWV